MADKNHIAVMLFQMDCGFTYIEKVLYAAGDHTKSTTFGKRDFSADPVDIYEFNGGGHVDCVLHPY